MQKLDTNRKQFISTLKEIKQDVIIVLLHQFLVKPILHVHVDGLMVPTVDMDRPWAGSVPGKQKNSWKVSNCYLIFQKSCLNLHALQGCWASVYNISIEKVHVVIRRIPLNTENHH